MTHTRLATLKQLKYILPDDVYLKEDLFPLSLTDPQKVLREEKSFAILAKTNLWMI